MQLASKDRVLGFGNGNVQGFGSGGECGAGDPFVG